MSNCWVCLRITPKKTLQLAHKIWSNGDTAREIGSEASEIIEQAYRKNPVFFSGRSSRGILSGLFYLLGFRYRSRKTQHDVMSAFPGKYIFTITTRTLKVSYRRWLMEFPELFHGFKFGPGGVI